MGQLYENYIRDFLKMLAESSRIIPEKFEHSVYKLRSGAHVCQPVPEASSFYYLDGPKKGLVYAREEDEFLRPVNEKALDRLCQHYEVNGVTPGEGVDGRRYVKAAEVNNPFHLKPGDDVPDDWRTHSIW